MKAAINGHVKCVKWLIRKGAKTDIENSKGKTAEQLVEEKQKTAKAKKVTAETAKTKLEKEKDKGKATDEIEFKRAEITVDRVKELVENYENVLAALKMAAGAEGTKERGGEGESEAREKLWKEDFSDDE